MWDESTLEPNRVLGQLFHADAHDASHDGAHAKRRNVETGRYFDANREDSDDAFENQGQGKQP